jgi:hypothetical protein
MTNKCILVISFNFDKVEQRGKTRAQQKQVEH